MEKGAVCTGFSKPYVAIYNNSGSAVTYSSGVELARGVEVNMEASTSEDNKFYANNGTAESTAGKFGSGTLNLTVDGLLKSAKKLILGLPDANDGWTPYGDGMNIPYMGFGCICRYQSGGQTFYVPRILPKIRFNVPKDAARTQEEDIDWQPQELTASVERDDTAAHNWKYEGDDYTTEADAESAIRTFLNIT